MKLTARSKGILTLVAVAAVFTLPMVMAWVWQPSGSTSNHGQLITPARPIEGIHLTVADGERVDLDSRYGKWTLLYVGAETCSKACEDSLYRLERVRLTQSKNINRVQSFYLTPETVSMRELDGRIQSYQGVQGFRLDKGNLDALKALLGSGDGKGELEGIFLLDPLGNAMMYYEPDADPSGMRKDLKRLLKVSQIG